MEKKPNSSMDGFVRRNIAPPRRIGRPSLTPAVAASGATGLQRSDAGIRGIGKASILASDAATINAGAANPGKGVNRGDIDDSLKAIDGDRKKANKFDPYRKARRRKRVKRIVIVLILLIIAGVAYFGVRTLIPLLKVTNGNIIGVLQQAELKKDTYGKTNILIFGTSEDDPGHGGATLTDSIMIMTIDQKTKSASMLSVPRDLWVQYGNACSVGYAGKINAVYTCGLQANNNDEGAASRAFVDKVGSVFGVDIQYYAHVNYTVVRDVVDAVGGVDVDIQSSDPRGILDRNFDWTCNYKCYLVKYPNGVAHLDGQHALALARARNDAGGYGLSRGNFDREQNQQKILRAVQEKALSGGTLANPITVLNLMDSLGDNIRTNFESKEISTLVDLAKNIKSSDIRSLDIASTDNQLVTTGTGPDGSSIVKPVAGLLDYSGLQAYMKGILSGDAASLENATVGIYNGSQTAGVAASAATTLKAAGFTIGAIDDATSDFTPKYTLYDTTGGKKPATLAKLEKQLGVKVTTGTPPGITPIDDFVVVIGTGTTAASGTTTQ